MVALGLAQVVHGVFTQSASAVATQQPSQALFSSRLGTEDSAGHQRALKRPAPRTVRSMGLVFPAFLMNYGALISALPFELLPLAGTSHLHPGRAACRNGPADGGPVRLPVGSPRTTPR